MKLAKNLLLTTAFATSAMLTTQANAGLITDWNFDLASGWTASTPGSVAESGVVTGNGVEGFDTLSWGDDALPSTDGWDVADVAGGAGTENINNDIVTNNDQSTLFIQNPTILNRALTLSETAPGSGIYSGDALGTRFYHLNNVLDGSAGSDPTLITAQLTDFFRLFGGGLERRTINPSFEILFKETSNDNNCGFDSVSECDDIFILTNPGLLVENFTLMGFSYTLTIGANGLGPLPAATCIEAGEAAGCVGLTTEEAGNNPVQFFLNLTAREVSAPATLALLGMGLLGFGAYSRKQRKAN